MKKPEKKLFLLDAMALIYRAHFAFSKNPRINSKGQNTGVMLGFTNSLFEIISKEKPSHIAVAFDTSAPTFRDKVYKEYKANRQAMPEDIRSGIPIVKDIIRAFDIPVIELDGYEADDIIGTLAKKAAAKEFEVYMMTPDKDFGQLVQDHVYLYKPTYMGNAVEILGIQEILKKWDIQRIDQVTDMLGLQGDASDNIPGIPGVGAKTASKLLKEFDTVENLIANVEQLKGKQKELVEEFGDQGILSKELATIKIDVPIIFDESDLAYTGPVKSKLQPIFEELEFRTLLKRILGEASTSSSRGSAQMSLFTEGGSSTAEVEEEAPVEKQDFFSTIKDYHVIDTPELRKSLIEYLKIQKEFSLDTVSDGGDPITSNLLGIAFSYYPNEAYYVPFSSFQEATKILSEFKLLLENEDILMVCQNLKYDLLILRKYGIDLAGPLFDVVLAHYMIDPDTSNELGILSERYLNYTLDPQTVIASKRKVEHREGKTLEYQNISKYTCESVDLTLQLKQEIHPLIDRSKAKKIYYELELPLVKVLADMEFEGIKVDPGALKELSYILEKESKKVEQEIFSQAGEEFNIASPKQLGLILFDKLKLSDKPKKTKSGQYATGEEILVKFAGEHKIAQDILDYRQYTKLKSTYVDALPEMISKTDHRIHTNFRQNIAATGRLSSINPNLQNIPIRTAKGKEIRKAFVPRNKDFILFSADYSQIELRLMASFSQDKHMIEAFKQGKDIHAITAAKIFKTTQDQVDSDMRRMAKSANFGMIYGISAFGLSQNLNIPRKEAKEIIDTYFEEFSSVKKYMDKTIKEAHERGYVETIMGRRRILRDINSRNATLRGYEERNAINAPLQGSAADIIKLAMIQIDHWLKTSKLKSKMILQVHDELIFDVHRSEMERVQPKVEEMMKNAYQLDVPIDVESGFGENWLEAH
ncbi:MAG: DNA polymerase I [Bacteroidetes bacterium]|nr:DNA polymerase I [Bacteroidota bacterium]